MPANITPTSAEEYFELPERSGLRDELLDGVYVVSPEPSVRHQRAAGALGRLLYPALAQRPDLELYAVPGNIVLDSRTVVEPDLFVVPRPGADRHWRDVARPVLVIEILSPGTAHHDRGIKRRLYQRAGIPEYWIVDLDARLVERWRPQDERPEILTDQLVWEPGGGAEALVIDLPALFTGVLDG